MGSCLCRDSDKEADGGEEEAIRQQQQQQNFSSLLLNPMPAVARKKVSENLSVASSSKGVGMGISLMMFQAGALAGYGTPPNVIDLNNLRAQMRKAKAEGRTVTVLNGCVYIDYQLKAQIPPGFNYNI